MDEHAIDCWNCGRETQPLEAGDEWLHLMAGHKHRQGFPRGAWLCSWSCVAEYAQEQQSKTLQTEERT